MFYLCHPKTAITSAAATISYPKGIRAGLALVSALINSTLVGRQLGVQIGVLVGKAVGVPGMAVAVAEGVLVAGPGYDVSPR